MAITYPYIGTNPRPLIPAGKTPQQRHQSAIGLGYIDPFATSTMMPSSPMARTNYLEPTMAAIQQKMPQREAFAGVPFPRPTMLPPQQATQQGVPLPQPRPAGMPQTRPSGLDQLRAAQLRMPERGTPQAAGLAAAGRQLLAAGGWQDKPVTLGQTLATGLQAYTEAEQAAVDRQSAAAAAELASNIDIAKLGIAAAKEQREGGQMFTGTSSFAQSANMLINLAPKITDGSASPQEQQAYNIAYQKQATPKTVSYMNEQGQQVTEELPAMDMSNFPVPEGYKPKETVVSETVKSIDMAEANQQLQQAQFSLNKLRNILESGDIGRAQMIGGIFYPTKTAVEAETEAGNLRLIIKELENLGALVGGDFEIIDKKLTSPNTMAGARIGAQGILYQLDIIEEQINSRLALRNPDIDLQLSGTKTNPIPAYSQDDFDNAPSKTYVLLIDEQDGTQELFFKD